MQDTKSFGDGDTISSCTFYVKEDDIPEGNETFLVQLISNVSSPSQALIKIIANDGVYGVVGFDRVSVAIVTKQLAL